jgi:lactoylglutathione lyase
LACGEINRNAETAANGLTFNPNPSYMYRFLLLCLLLCSQQLLAQNAPAPKATRFNHIAFTVKDLGKSAAFYQHLLGLDTIPEPFHDGRHVWLKVSEQGALHLIQGSKIPVSIKESHLCFSVASVDAFIAKLQKAGMAFENWAGEKNRYTLRPDGVKQVYLQDPDGYWIEVNDQQ